MGLFSSPSDKYSQDRHPFPLEDFKRIFRNLHVKSVTEEEEHMVAQELESYRSGDGKLSLRNFYNVIHSLRNKNKISKSDEHILMEQFINYFDRFSK